MIRTLVMIAVAGFVLSVGALSAAVAIGGPDLVARGGWSAFSGKWGSWRGWDADWNGNWDVEWKRDRDGWDDTAGAGGPETTRTLDWSGADSLDIDLPADVRYIQQAGPGRVEVTGPQRAVERVIVRGDSIRYDQGRRWTRPKLTIVVRAPDIRSFDVSGRNTLSIEGYRQARLSLEVSGDASVKAEGEADAVSLEVSDSAGADLGRLKAKGVEAEVSGAGEAALAPTDWARLEVSGAAEVRLLTDPPRLESDVTGAGRVRRGGAPAPTGEAL
ncbi:DUF2807 domain-containing protein [Phenylobacterium sp.]|uniref:GIN domain-containing protein n=1 Tax=Phenylobacterium sp. TaxID=1871053 RepID=UPI00301D8B0C